MLAEVLIMNSEKRQTLNVPEVAQILGVSRNLCYQRIRSGEIPVIKIGRRLLISTQALEKILCDGQFLSKS